MSLAAPFSSSEIVVVTGASGVFLSCYLIPIINHILLYCGWCAARWRLLLAKMRNPSPVQPHAAPQCLLLCSGDKGCTLRHGMDLSTTKLRLVIVILQPL